MSSIAIRTEHRQQQTLTPRLQQAVRLLQLSSLDFAQKVQEAMGKNPFLETADEGEGDTSGTPPSMADEGQGGDSMDKASLANDLSPRDALSHGDADAATSDAPRDGEGADMESDRDMWQPGPSGTRGTGGDGEGSVMDMVAADTSLREHLHGQLNVMPLSERDMVLAKAIVESIDDDGYLRDDLETLRGITGLQPPPDMDEMTIALRQVQSLDPCGVAARNVGECLLLQLPLVACPEERALAREVITHHLDRLAKRDIVGLARELSRSVADIETVCERIRHLDPRPGWRFGSSNVQFLTPDVIVRKVKGQWSATLNPAIVPKVRLNQVYAELFQRHRDSQHTELAAHLQEARWTVRNVEQRFATILSVTQAILKRQRHFLEFGALAMKPLGLREIADEVGLHESTVSRVTNNKYMSTPVGVFELKYFFSRAMPTSGGGACSATAIRGVIQGMIDDEDPTAPLSDAEIARQLARQGLSVARRTVTKYRQTLRIPAVERRRRHA
ncbi:MAG: RNA polymerase factor sigma-54 [Rubrivivax sp.]|nr:MAG: RNA polymerase factor sigma-54 [Rubrivivax sp.]